jgi:tetratricopeptide (TPR) repeat protein
MTTVSLQETLPSSFAAIFAESANGRLLAKFAVAVFAFGALIHGQAIGFDWVKWDDPPLVVNNTSIRSLSSLNLKAIFTPVAGKTYQPIRVLSYAADYALFGLKPAAFHAVNVFLHCLASALLVPLIFALLGELRKGRGSENCIIALLAALVFVAHPVNVESVSWVASRKYGLLALFSFSSFLCYLRSTQMPRPDWRFAVAAVVLGLLATMSSPFGVTLPVLVLFFELCRGQLRANYRMWIVFGLPFLVLYAIIAFALFGGNSGPSVGPEHITGKAHWTFFTMLRVVFDYGANLVCPLFLNHKYPNHFEQSILNWKILVVISALFLIAAFLIRDLRRGHRCPAFCVGWMAIAWAPVSNVVPISHTMADRYMYIPIVGFCIFLGLSANAAARRFSARWVLTISGIIIAAFAAISAQRAGVWRTDRTLWAASLRTNPDNPTALFNIGVYEHNEGNVNAAEKKYRRSLELFEANAGVHHNLGTLLATKKDFANSIKHFKRAIALAPSRFDSHRNLGGVYQDQADPDSAAIWFGEWSELAQVADGYMEAGLGFGHKGMHQRAIEQFQHALRIEPQNAQALKNIGISHAIIKDYGNAARYFEAALVITPDSPELQSLLRRVRGSKASQTKE